MEGFRAAGRLLAASMAAAGAALAPWLDLAVRLWLAQAFLVVEVDQMMRGPVPVPSGLGWWLRAAHDAMVSSPGLVVGTVCPLLLAAGLLARPAAVAMLVPALLMPALLMPVAGPGVDGAHLFWTALLLRVALLGPGTLSLDHVLSRGAEHGALPGAAAVAGLLKRLRHRGGPVWQLGLRLWLAAAPAGTALAALGLGRTMQPGIAPGLPALPGMLAALAPAAALGAALLLATGTAARLTAFAFLRLVPLGRIGTTDVRLPWALLLGLIVVHGAGP